ncbi:hypothetical protein NE237_026747 [Protea cynaroides]|uniref:Uncharacterized protein n=1 Tax=Protea cynaroides TaxID=273540 RepID=A0A9Q0GPA5_9MAGN|nr:hypothetical protein NE237_026747 [Protea cynaroides]
MRNGRKRPLPCWLSSRARPQLGRWHIYTSYRGKTPYRPVRALERRQNLLASIGRHPFVMTIRMSLSNEAYSIYVITPVSPPVQLRTGTGVG